MNPNRFASGVGADEERLETFNGDVVRLERFGGNRQRQKHEVDEVLAECHRLALSAQHDFGPSDTS